MVDVGDLHVIGTIELGCFVLRGWDYSMNHFNWWLTSLTHQNLVSPLVGSFCHLPNMTQGQQTQFSLGGNISIVEEQQAPESGIMEQFRLTKDGIATHQIKIT